MTAMPNDINPERITPLTERVFEAFRDKQVFTAKQVVDFFQGRENRDAVYRAVRALEAEGRIRYHGYVDRKKVYTSVGSSDLPHIRLRSGQMTPLSYVIQAVPKSYDEDMRWNTSKPIDKLLPLLGYLFVIAQESNAGHVLSEFKKTIVEINDIRALLTWMLELVNSVYSHPSMSGNMELFKDTFGGKDEAMPSLEDLNEFKVWLTRYAEREVPL